MHGDGEIRVTSQYPGDVLPANTIGGETRRCQYT